MPFEYSMLRDRSEHLLVCPNCQAEPFESFCRGGVHRRKYRWLFFGEWPYSAVICRECKEIVGYELTESEWFNCSWGFGRSVTFVQTWKRS
jgi:formate dehydrogenase maturation protein FdhE